MTKYENNKRCVSRAVTLIDNKILLMKRNKKINETYVEYYTIPGGGIEDNETCEEAAIRETLEETCVNITLNKYLGREEYDTGVVYWYKGSYISGNPTLGGEELERNSIENHYEVVLIEKDKINELNFLGQTKNYILKVIESNNETENQNI